LPDTPSSYTGSANKFLKSDGSKIIFSSLSTLSVGSGLSISTGSTGYTGLSPATISVSFSGVGSATTASRSDHSHTVTDIKNVSANRLLANPTNSTSNAVHTLVSGALKFNGVNTLESKLEYETAPKLGADLDANFKALLNLGTINPTEIVLDNNWKISIINNNLVLRQNNVIRFEFVTDGNLKFNKV
jgi:hypothetical protein